MTKKPKLVSHLKNILKKKLFDVGCQFNNKTLNYYQESVNYLNLHLYNILTSNTVSVNYSLHKTFLTSSNNAYKLHMCNMCNMSAHV